MEIENKHVYEIGLHLSPILSEGEVDDAMQKIRQAVESNGGAVTTEERPKSFALQYQLVRSRGGKRERSGTSYFGHMRIEAPSSAIEVIGKSLMAEESVLRHSIVKIEPRKAVTRQRSATFRSVLASEKIDGEAGSPEVAPEVIGEEIDKEIEKLIVE